MLKSDQDLLRRLVVEMRAAYSRGENVMARARKVLKRAENDPVSTLIAYDLQSGSYIEAARQDPDSNTRWCRQVAELIKDVLPSPMNISTNFHKGTILEIGCGEATTLADVVKTLGTDKIQAYGFDLSWSRVAAGNDWLKENSANALLFVADLFHIPIAENSIDVVYTSHSLEPNRYREAAALSECLRVARRAVVIVEPIYELASGPARRRMDKSAGRAKLDSDISGKAAL